MSSKRNITYKCPYCDKRFNKENLVIHVGDIHDDMIPEGYSAFRVVFDYVNKKPAGYNGKCIICGKESGWDENKGKYNRLCSNPECKKKYIKSFEDRMMKTNGVTRISSTADGQAKMLANRKISGEYKFQDGGIRTYTGTYEKKALEFMDKVMNCKSEDITTPGPILEYIFEDKKHIYISDIYYAPYNLIIEVKDGGDNPNNRNMPEYRAKQIAKEKFIIKNTDYNYLRLTNNDFSQLLAVFMELKMEMTNDTPERVIRINEGIISNRLQYPYKYGEAKKINKELADKINSTDYPWYFINITELINSGVDINLYGFDEEPIEGVNNSKYKRYHLYNKKVKTFHGRDSLNPSLRKYSKFNKGAAKTKDIVLKEDYIEEGFLKSEPDILYNKEAFDNGDINICFVTGHSGSGNSTLAHGQESKTVEVYELDDLQCIADRFTMANLKEYGDLIYTYFKGPGKKFYTTWKQLEKDKTPGKDYEDKLYPGFVAYAIDWAKKHKDKKYIIEGVWIFCNNEEGKPYFDPSYFKDYAFYIKGTSAIKSKWRAAKRDMKYDQKEESHSKLFWFKSFTKSFFLKNWKWYKIDEDRINVFRNYFKNKPETVLSEATLLESVSQFRKVLIDRSLIESNPVFKHLREDHCKGYAFYDKDDLVGFVNTEDKDGDIWVQALEIMPNYRQQGYAKDLLDIAVKELKANYLSVSKKNTIAFEMYKKYGFKVYKETESMYFMSLKENISEASKFSDYKFIDIKSNKSKALEYLKANTETSSYAKDTIDNYNGELVIYNNSMIGRILVGDKRDKGFITDFYIDENHRGNGLGSKLIDDAINIYDGYDLLVDKDNTIAIDMYKRRGFIIIKTVKNQYWMKLKSVKEDTNMTEAMNALMTGYIPGSVDNPNNVYIVNYMQNNVFSGEDPNEDCIGVSDNLKLTNLIVRDNGILKKVDESFLKDKEYKVYILEMSKEEVSNRLSKYMNNPVDKYFIYETLTGHKLYTEDQIQFETSFIPVTSYEDYINAFKEVCDNYFMAKDKTSVENIPNKFIPKEVRYTNNSGLMYTENVYSLDDYISSTKPKINILECLDISVKEG